MIQEARLGRTDFPTNGHSPQTEQEGYSQIATVALNPLEAGWNLLSNPIEIVHDIKEVWKDAARSARDYGKLLVHPVRFGIDVPRGNGETVIGQGGLMSTVFHYIDTFDSTRWMNYNPVSIPWGINIAPPREVGKRLLARSVSEAKKSGKRVKGKGHSLGVYDWLAAFAENPYQFVESVDHLVLDGGPWPTRINRAVEVVYAASSFLFDKNHKEGVLKIVEKIPLLFQAEDAGCIKVTSIDSTADRIVRGMPIARKHRYAVKDASHGFLSGHPDTLTIEAYSLAGREDELPELGFQNYELVMAA